MKKERNLINMIITERLLPTKGYIKPLHQCEKMEDIKILKEENTRLTKMYFNDWYKYGSEFDKKEELDKCIKLGNELFKIVESGGFTPIDDSEYEDIDKIKEILEGTMEELEAVTTIDDIVELATQEVEPTLYDILKKLRINKQLINLTFKDIIDWELYELKALLQDLDKYTAKITALILRLPRYGVVSDLKRILTRIDILRGYAKDFIEMC